MSDFIADYLALPEVQFFRRWWWVEVLIFVAVALAVKAVGRLEVRG